MIMESLSVYTQFLRKGETTVSFVETNNVVIYTRVSSREQAMKNMSLENQKEALERYALSEGLNVVQAFGGTYESAKTDGRKEFQRMLSFVKQARKSTPISKILVYSLDRFSRSGGEAIVLAKELRKKYGLRIYAYTQPIDTRDASGQFQESIQLIFSNYDNEQRRLKSVNGMIRAFEHGVWCLRPPVGYSSRYENGKRFVEPNDEAKYIRWAFKWKAEGVKSMEILERLRARGYKRLSKQQLSHIIRNPFYCGIIVVKMLKGKVVESVHPAIISKELFLKVHNINNKQGKSGVSHNKEFPDVPLKVFMRCGECDTPYTGYVVKAKNIWYYKCRTKGCKNNHNAKRLNQQFETFLEQFSVAPVYLEPLKEILSAYFLEHNSDAEKQSSYLKDQLTQIKNKQLKISEQHFIEEKMNAEVYGNLAAKFEAERIEIIQELERCQQKSSNHVDFIDSALKMATKVAPVWASSDFSTKERLQKLLYPEGITYDAKKGRFRTSRSNEFFQLIAGMTGGTSENKKRTNLPNVDLSSQVGPAGFEPATLPILSGCSFLRLERCFLESDSQWPFYSSNF